ncbi:hypothetical protein B0T21DRAFT_175598 [Apiosordaria backusii]|uniref:Uncharacterized protein n=1 Tax=Apiosordaria backusii TaxID=314023 RepID=A0AA40BKV9_9PEZI|nr:hypothetical protein B0T21DRAFT_175598 [Apiosordaria backusii]
MFSTSHHILFWLFSATAAIFYQELSNTQLPLALIHTQLPWTTDYLKTAEDVFHWILMLTLPYAILVFFRGPEKPLIFVWSRFHRTSEALMEMRPFRLLSLSILGEKSGVVLFRWKS